MARFFIIPKSQLSLTHGLTLEFVAEEAELKSM